MVRMIFYITCFILLKSCCYSGIVSEYGLPRKAISKYNKSSIMNIDTMSVYPHCAYFTYSKSDRKITDYNKEENSKYPYISYLKYYSNGKVGLFVISKTEILNRDAFNPKRAKMGYYYQYNTNNIRQKISTIGDCTLYISERQGYVKGDSIVLFDKYGHGNVYKKYNIPKKELSNWNPDW